jgi:hypothetical protein
MSRGFLNPKGEEFSAYNASPFRNLNVRAENNDNLATHNEQFTAINHPENRSPDYRLVPATLPSGFIASPGMTVTTTAVTASAGVWAQQIYSINGAALFTSASAGLGTAGAVVIGLDADPSSSTNYTDIDYGWYLDTSTTAAIVIESGVVKHTFVGIRTAGDVFSVVKEGELIKYLHNGTIMTTSPVEHSTKLYFNGAFKTSVSEMVDISFIYLSAQYDNANVTHALPQSSLQYTWIKDSAETTISEFQGYATGSDIQFYSSSIDFDDSPLNDVYIDPVNATQSFDFTGSVYTYGTWKEIRGGELGLSRYYRNHNILPVTNAEDSTTQYIEPPVVAKHQPLDYNLAIDTSLNPYSIKSPYGNTLMRYSNDDINKLYDFRITDKDTEYAKIKDLYLKKSVADPGNPVKAFYSLTYGETVYPQSKNAYMAKVRIRGSYNEVAGTGVNGYDRLYGTQNTFYSTTNQRTDGSLNSQGFAATGTFSQEVYRESFEDGTNWTSYSSRLGRDNTSGLVRDSVSGSVCFVMGGQQNLQTQTRYLEFKQPVTGAFTVDFEVIFGPYTPLGLSGTTLPVTTWATQPIRFYTKPAYQGEGSHKSWQSTGGTTIGVDNVQYSEGTMSTTLTEPSRVAIALDAEAFPDYHSKMLGFRNFVFTYTPVDSKNFNAFQPLGTSGAKSFFQSASFDKNVGELNSDTDITIGSKEVLPSLSYFEETNLSINNIVPANSSELENDDNTQVLLGYNERLSEDISSKFPSYEDYGAFAENEKVQVKEASILPEFRISEHMNYYVDQESGNFRAKNKSFLTLQGSEFSSSADSRVSVNFDNNFEQSHLVSEEIKNFKKIKEDHIGYSKPRRIKITAKGVKKLLPYNGFYPDTRTVQLGNELSSSLSAGIESYIYSSASIERGENLSTDGNSGYFGFLKTMASPGLLFNSIKSGVSVDYPIFTTPPDMEGRKFESKVGDQALSKSPDLRLPFESLYNLDQFYPKKKNLYPVFSGDKLQDSKDSSPFYFQWNGAKKPSYELAMHNFLAESVKFFLKGSSLNSFISKPESSFLEVEANKTYFMDITLDDATLRNKFINIKGEKDKFPFFESQLVATASTPIKGTDLGFATDVVNDGRGGHYAIVGAPHFPEPSANETGKIIVNHVDSAGEKTLLTETSDIFIGASDNFGSAVTICSGSTGVFFAAQAPNVTSSFGSSSTGKVLYYKYTDAAGVVKLTNLAGSPATGTSIDFGCKLASLYDDESSKVYFALMDSSNNNGTDSLALNLNYVSISPGTTVNSAWQSDFDHASALSGTSGYTNPNDYLGIDLKKTSFPSAPTNDRILFAASSAAYSDSGNKGAAILRYSDGTAAPTSKGPYVDLNNPGAGGFGADISICPAGNQSTTPYGYVAIGRAFLTTGCDSGSIALYFPRNGIKSSFDLSSDDLINERIDTKGPATSIGFNQIGLNLSLEMDKATNELSLFFSNPYWAQSIGGSANLLYGAIEHHVHPTKYNKYADVPVVFPSGTLAGFYESDYDLARTTGGQFGASFATDFTNGELLIAAGSPEYSGSLSAGGLSHVLYGKSATQDYKQHGKLFGHPVDGYYDPAYCAYTPPGFYGQSTARISFSSSIGGPVSLEEIFKDATVENLTVLNPNRQQIITGSAVSQLTTLQEQSKMNVSSSIALFERVINPGVEFSISEEGDITKADRAVPSAKNSVRWAISTKYECPVVNVSSSKYSDNYTTYNSLVTASFAELNSGTSTFEPPQSTWTSYSDTKSQDKYSFVLKESFTKEEIDTSRTGSLIDLCGFTAGTKDVGTVADNKTVTEAIMVIPYTDREIPRKTTEIENGKHFFRLNASELKRQKKSLEDNGFAVSEEVRDTSITDMIRSMKEYVIPPQYNHLAYKDIKPFVCYFLEFEKTLDNEDLTTIWQGMTPSIAINPEIDEVEIAHDFDKHNMFHNIDIPNDIKFMVFKVKKKAEWNYYNITTDSTDDDRFRFDFQGNGQVEVVPDYSYNWPYDFFSLVERAAVSVDFTLKKSEEDE